MEAVAGVLTVLKAAGPGSVATDEDLPPVLGDILEAIKISATANENVTIALKVTKAMLDKAAKPEK